jgi:hypothetical protein
MGFVASHDDRVEKQQFDNQKSFGDLENSRMGFYESKRSSLTVKTASMVAHSSVSRGLWLWRAWDEVGGRRDGREAGGTLLDLAHQEMGTKAREGT